MIWQVEMALNQRPGASAGNGETEQKYMHMFYRSYKEDTSKCTLAHYHITTIHSSIYIFTFTISLDERAFPLGVQMVGYSYWLL